MKRCILFFVGLLFFSEVILAQTTKNPDLATLQNIGIPVLVINTVDSVEPTCDYVAAPEGECGAGITNVTKVPGQIVLYQGTDEIYNSGSYVEDASGMTIKIHGNTSAYTPKKPFKIKLEKKADLLNRGDKKYKDKDWLLLRNDVMSLNSLIGFKTNELCGLQWTPQMEFVNVIMNGDYRGVYMLTESVDQGNTRLNVNEDSGYIFEDDPYWWNEDVYIEDTNGLKYTFKYPDPDDLTETQKEYLENLLDTVCSAIDKGTYSELIDLNSFASWAVAHDILGTYDSAGSNIYLTKYDSSDTTKIMMGNLWDFDTIERTDSVWAPFHQDKLIFGSSDISSDTTFMQGIKS